MYLSTTKRLRKSGEVSTLIQICVNIRENSRPRKKVIRTIGTAKNEEEIEYLSRIGTKFIHDGLEDFYKTNLLFKCPDESCEYYNIQPAPKTLSHDLEVESKTSDGLNDIYGPLYDSFKIDKVLSKSDSEILKEVILARILKPSSKRKTQEILARDMGFEISLDKIYRMLSKIGHKEDLIKSRVFNNTKELFEGKLDVVFFDVTTLYFESVVDDKDELRSFGYSKDQKSHSTQVVLALATTTQGLPIGYKVFPGKTAETTTLIQCLNEWKTHIEIGKVVFVADRGLFSMANILTLNQLGYEFIVACKLRKLSASIQSEIFNEATNLSQDNPELSWAKDIKYLLEEKSKVKQFLPCEGRLIVSYSHSRAKKDAHDREKLLTKLKKVLDKSKDSTKLISNSGYKKFAGYEGKKIAFINKEKVEKDKQWDGIHGVFTNTLQPIDQVLSRYRELWTIEESFRICKNDLKMRPIYHFTPLRIKAHILTCYITFSITRTLQFKLKNNGIRLSLERIKEELIRVESTVIKDKKSGKSYKVPSKMSEIAKQIYQSLGIEKKQKLQAL